MSYIKRRNWSNAPWMLISKDDLMVEKEQCQDEGRDISSVEDELNSLLNLDLDIEENQQKAENLMDKIQLIPIDPSIDSAEPSDLESIKAARPAPQELPALKLSEQELLDKALGAWQGRASGCLLGKPVEGRRIWQIEKYLKSQNRWSLSSYFSANSSKEIAAECGFDISNLSLFEEGITCMPEDDDTNYTVSGLSIIKQYGKNFTPESVGNFWLSNLPLLHVCTAERTAYRNLANSIPPPYSASFRNCYREWIGAQIRADFYGYVNPGNPEKAAEFAWRDASISHVKNGIYGAMWVAAMIAAAYVSDDVETIIKAGLAQIPASCRLTKAINQTIDKYKSDMSYKDAAADFNSRWNENKSHHWSHTISNAEIVTISLLWGNKDYEKTICSSVMAGFDTDCNGATCGSIMGTLLGANKMPAKWIEPLKDTLITGVAGYNSVSLTAMAHETVELIKSDK